MVRRIYVEKKAPFAVRAKELQSEMSEYLGIETEAVRVLVRYDVKTSASPRSHGADHGVQRAPRRRCL